MKPVFLAALLTATVATAQGEGSFDAADKYLREESNARACDGFTAFLKASPQSPLAREASAKQARACLQAGRSGNWSEALRKLSTEGEKDYARAYAAATWAERTGADLQAALPLLKQAAAGEDRVGKEARALYVRFSFVDLDRYTYDRARTLQTVSNILEISDSANQKGRARLYRARVNLREQQRFAEAEKELRELGAGSTDVADDALYELAVAFEGQSKFVAALELYDTVVTKFSPATSNVRESSQRRAADIRRPVLNLSISYIELPGAKPQVNVSYRNVTNAKWSLRKVNPAAMNARDALESERTALLATATSVVSSWDSKLTVPTPYAYGSTSFDLDLNEAGAFMLSVDADGQKASELALLTPHVTVVKTGRDDLVTFTADAVTGQAVAGADVTAYVRQVDTSQYDTLTARADATGVARFALNGKKIYNVVAWASGQGSFSYARSYSGSWYQQQREHLAYLLTDRPLYKPGETVNFKLFIRSREDGPTVPMANQAVTLYVRDASGREVARPSLTTNEFGTATFTLKLGKDAQLGAWSMYVQTSGQSLVQNTSTFRVEEYKPPEYTVSVSPVGNPKPGEKVKLKVSASFFFGGPVANAQGRALVTVRGWQHRFNAWPEDAANEPDVPQGYDEDDQYRGPNAFRYRGGYYYQPQFASHTLPFKTGADGTAEVEVPAVEGQNDLEYVAQVFVTDASRREVSGQGTIHASKTPFFADLRADRFLYKPGERVQVKLRAEDANGRPVSPELLARLVRVTDTGVSAPIAQAKTTLVGGAGTVRLDADALGPVRIELYDAAAGANAPLLASSDVWLTNDAKPMIPPGSNFQVFIDQAPLKVGQSLRALVVVPTGGGHALLTIENERLQFAKGLELNGRARFVEIPLNAEMAPNAWLHVQRFENVTQYQQQLPIRVRGSDVELPVRVSFAKGSTEPGSSVPVSVEPGSNAPKGASFEVAVTVVDEALLAIEPMRHDFLSFFGKKQRQLLVQTSSTMNQKTYRRVVKQTAQPVVAADKAARPEIQGHLDRDEKSKREDAPARRAAPAPMGAASGMMADALAAPSESAPAKKSRMVAKDDAAEEEQTPGGNDGSGPPVKVRTDFGSSSGWFPQLTGKSGGGAISTPVKFTDSLTSWRTVAWVVSNGPYLGVGQGTIRTEKPLMVRLQGPRFFTEKDEVTLSAIVTSRLSTATDVDVSLSAPGLKALGPTSKRVHVEAGKDLRFETRFKVEEPGDRVVRAVAKSATTADAMEWTLPAVVHGSAQRKFYAGRLGDQVQVEFELPNKRKPSLTRLELTLSPSLLAVMFDGLPYLAQYPYGCVEQTLSRFVPAAVAARAVKDLGLPANRVPANLDDMVDAGLKRLYGFQHSDGGWGWWQTDTTNKWMSAYAVYGLAMGKKAGLAVDTSVLERGRAYLRGVLGAAQNDPETQAFMTYALAETGGAPKSALDFAFAGRTRLSARGRAVVALALLAANDPRARIAVENLDDVVKAAASRPDAAVGEVNDAWSTSAAIEATAYTLMAMVKYDVKSPNIKPLTDFLVLRRNGGKWRSTRDTAFAIFALTELAKKEEAATRAGSFSVLLNGKEVKKVSFKQGGLDLTSPVVLGDAAFRPGKNTLEIRRDGAGTGYYAASFDVFNQNDFIKGVGGDVTVTRTYTLLGKPSTSPTEAPTEYGMPLESGTRVRVDLEVKANKAVEFLMIEDLKAAGLEAVMQKSGPEVCNYACAHAELRTDRVALFMQAIPVGVTKLSYELRAEVPGKFAALPARVEAMYAPEIQATSDEMRFEVRDAPDQNVVGR